MVPAEIELTETTDKWGTFSATLKNGMLRPICMMENSNGAKDQFQLRDYEGTTFFMVRLNSYMSYSGTISGNKIQGTVITGGETGTFTATVK